MKFCWPFQFCNNLLIWLIFLQWPKQRSRHLDSISKDATVTNVDNYNFYFCKIYVWDQVGELATILSPYYSDDKGNLVLKSYKVSGSPPSHTSLGKGETKVAEALLDNSPGAAEVPVNWNPEATKIQ